MIRLLLVDDHAVMREGCRRLLERRVDLRIEAEAASATEALQHFRDRVPDVVITDVALPDMGGIELIGRLRQRDAQARILAFSMHRDPLFGVQALRAGALGYVTKSSPPEVLVQAVYQVSRRERVLSPDIAPEIALQLLDTAAGDAAVNPLESLSPREFEVLRRLIEGETTQVVADALHLSVKTVQNTQSNIRARLGVRNDIELVKLAMRWQLIGGP